MLTQLIRRVVCIAGVLGAGFSTVTAAQEFPARPIHIITADPGGAFDFEARLISQGVSASTGQAVIIENRGGANGVLAGQMVAKAPADGYMLLYYGSTVWLQPLMRQGVPYDILKDFAPVTLAVNSPGLVVVANDLPVKTIQDLIAYAKAHPGELNYGSGGLGGANHLAAELFKNMAGVDIVRVPYKGAAPALNDLMGGKLQAMFPIMASGLPFVRVGRIRALAVTSAQPSTTVPQLPTVASAGLPGYEATQISALFAPAKTPDAIINKLNQEVSRVLNKPEVRERLSASGSEIVASTPAQLTAAVKADLARMGKVIKDANIRDE